MKDLTDCKMYVSFLYLQAYQQHTHQRYFKPSLTLYTFLNKVVIRVHEKIVFLLCLKVSHYRTTSSKPLYIHLTSQHPIKVCTRDSCGSSRA